LLESSAPTGGLRDKIEQYVFNLTFGSGLNLAILPTYFNIIFIFDLLLVFAIVVQLFPVFQKTIGHPKRTSY
jgi:hypothetical protein